MKRALKFTTKCVTQRFCSRSKYWISF